MKSAFGSVGVLVLLCAKSSVVLAAISIDDYSHTTNDRFTNSAAFILNGHDLSGVGRSENSWATAISRNVVMSANHARSNGLIYFYPNNDPTSTPVTRTIVAGERVGNNDLYVSVLNEPLPASIAHYRIADQPLSAPAPGGAPWTVHDAGTYQGRDVFMVGLSRYDHTSDPNRDLQHSQAVGRNKVTGYVEVPFLVNPDNDSLIMAKDSAGDTAYNQYEARFADGDSGGPTFVLDSGELVLIGTNAFIYDSADFTIGGEGSGINYLGNYSTFLGEYVALNAVPEPSTVVLVVMSLAALFRRRRCDSVAA